MNFIAWPEIESFHNIRKYTSAHPEILDDNSTVQYYPKVKLHGTNAAVQILSGQVIAQSRTALLSIENDNAGFARWVDNNRDAWTLVNDWIIFGEWCGKGIQKGVAISSIDKKIFAVFAAQRLSDLNTYFISPDDLQDLVKNIPDVYVLPWYNDGIEIDWLSSVNVLTQKTEQINQWVSDVETNDPWVENIFNVNGTGEGLIFYPTPHARNKHTVSTTMFNNLVFKAKGELHKNIKTATPAQVNPEIASSINEFVELVLTEARLNQGATTIGIDVKLTGKFMAWCLSDVEKETKDELAASNLTWKQVQKALSDKARLWYLAKTREL